jgi:hypothetical protein
MLLEQLYLCSIFGPSKEIWAKESQNILDWLSKMDWPYIFAHNAEAGKRHCKA